MHSDIALHGDDHRLVQIPWCMILCCHRQTP